MGEPKTYERVAGDKRREIVAHESGAADAPSLNVAWAAAEASLPDGWYISSLRRRSPRSRWSASATLAGDLAGASRSGFGPTLPDALLALAGYERSA